jgi:hypothetical protein
MNTLHKLLKCSVIGALIAVLFAVALPKDDHRYRGTN